MGPNWANEEKTGNLVCHVTQEPLGCRYSCWTNKRYVHLEDLASSTADEHLVILRLNELLECIIAMLEKMTKREEAKYYVHVDND